MWVEIGIEFSEIDVLLKIIDDALCYGFEFKVENHSLYYRERG